jgi:hypothetical protein
MLTNGMYKMNFLGQGGVGAGVLYIGNGLISGADAGGADYDGTYQEVGGRIKGLATLTMSVNGTLVTGQAVPAGQTLQIAADWPLTFANGQPQQIQVAGRTVSVTFQKIRDLP